MRKDNYNFEQLLLNQLTIPSQLLTSYASLGLNESEMMLLLHIHRFMQTGNDFPTPQELSMYVSLSEKECSYLLRTLIQKGFLSITQVKNDQGKRSESYSLNPLWQKLLIEDEQEEQESDHIGSIFVLFEQEFGRPLSPVEIETINEWIDTDTFDPTLIKAALRESVLMNKLNFKYIDRILRNWHQKGIQSVQQAREYSRTFRDHQTRDQQPTTEANKHKKDQSLFYYNWLESDD